MLCLGGNINVLGGKLNILGGNLYVFFDNSKKMLLSDNFLRYNRFNFLTLINNRLFTG